MAVSISVLLLLGAAVWILHRYAGMKLWHGVICVLFGFFLATSSFAPQVRNIVTGIIAAISGQH